MSEFEEVLYIKDSVLEKYTAESYDDIHRDPRGLVLLWEPPDPSATYIMGLDPTMGRTGWSRATRTDGDHKIDNGAIEIFKVDGDWEYLFEEVDGRKVPVVGKDGLKEKVYRDVQVAEYAAPCDAVEIARVANVLGRVYAGSEGDQCQLIWEAYPGPGILTTQELLRLGYGNLWMWEYITGVAEETNRMGWYSTRESQKTLWYRTRRHLLSKKAIIRSKFLLSEYANAEIDVDKMRASAAYGHHDDRFQAANMCFWAGHRWAMEIERTNVEVRTSPATDYQLYAPTLPTTKDPDRDPYMTYEDWKSSALEEWDNL